METFGSRLKQEREKLRLSQTDFAAACGQSKASQIRYEAGDRSPDGNYMAKAAEIGVDVAYVLTGLPWQLHTRDTEATNMTPAKQAAETIAQLALSKEDAEILTVLAIRLAAGTQSK